MSNRIVIAFKNQIVVLVIVIGAIIVAIPVFILSLIRIGWELGVPWVARRRPGVVEKITSIAENIEKHIGPQKR
ncbi:MAG: hypothetical protein ACM3IH_02440 [Sphingobacteriales bacterium]|jgi:hypothetical protein